jgi:hypothetical protein
VAADGESEQTILEILDRADTKRFDGVPGVLWRDGTDIRREKPRPLIRDIDHLPLRTGHTTAPTRHITSIECNNPAPT